MHALLREMKNAKKIRKQEVKKYETNLNVTKYTGRKLYHEFMSTRNEKKNFGWPPMQAPQ